MDSIAVGVPMTTPAAIDAADGRKEALLCSLRSMDGSVNERGNLMAERRCVNLTKEEAVAVDKITANIVAATKQMAFPEPVIAELVGNAVMRSKQNGLLLAVADLNNMYWAHHKYADQLRKRIQGRLDQGD